MGKCTKQLNISIYKYICMEHGTNIFSGITRYLRFTMKSHFFWPHSIYNSGNSGRWRWRIQGPCVHGSAPGRAQWGPGEDRWNVAGCKVGNMSIWWRDLPIHSWLAVWNIFHFSIQLVMSSSLTNSIIFQRGRSTTNQIQYMSIFRW